MYKKMVVGYDGSTFSQVALAWALDEANRTATPVELVYADEWPFLAPAAGMIPAPALPPESSADKVITDTMNRAVARAKRTHPLLDVSASTVRAHASTALIERSRHAHLMVLGVRRRSRVSGLFGSVVSTVTARAHCPVVVVHGDPPADAVVVAGVDDSAAAPGVLTFAAQRAMVRKGPPPDRPRVGPNGRAAGRNTHRHGCGDRIKAAAIRRHGLPGPGCLPRPADRSRCPGWPSGRCADRRQCQGTTPGGRHSRPWRPPRTVPGLDQPEHAASRLLPRRRGSRPHRSALTEQGGMPANRRPTLLLRSHPHRSVRCAGQLPTQAPRTTTTGQRACWTHC
jgi:nucleotide-binding universal stress UspA family protein